MALTEAQAAALVDGLEDDAATLHAIVHGPEDETVPTDNGDVPTAAKVMADAADAIEQLVEDQVADYLANAENEITMALATAEAARDKAADWAEAAEDVEVETGKYSAKHHALKAEDAEALATAAFEDAEEARDKAEAWAEAAEDVEVETGQYSALHHATKAEAAAAAAAATVSGLANVLTFKGGWDASTAAYPADPDVGDLWTVTVAGMIAATEWRTGDEMIWSPAAAWIQVGYDLTGAEISTLLEGNFSDAAHGARGGGEMHALATDESAGFMSAADKIALAGKAEAVAGVPAGGTEGQVLSKSSGIDYAMDWIDPPVSGVNRELLIADRTIYVRADGDDDNTGLVNDAGGAKLTIQAAINDAYRLDLNNFNVKIKVADGTYTDPIALSGAWTGLGTVTVEGNLSTPANVLLHATANNLLQVNDGARLTIDGMKLQTTTSGAVLQIANSATVTIGTAVNFGACAGRHIDVRRSAVVNATSYFITGSAFSHVLAEEGGHFSHLDGTVSLSGTPAWGGAGWVASAASTISCYNTTISGAATGMRYAVSTGASINTFGSGANYFPGNAAGSAGTGYYS